MISSCGQFLSWYTSQFATAMANLAKWKQAGSVLPWAAIELIVGKAGAEAMNGWWIRLRGRVWEWVMSNLCKNYFPGLMVPAGGADNGRAEEKLLRINHFAANRLSHNFFPPISQARKGRHLFFAHRRMTSDWWVGTTFPKNVAAACIIFVSHILTMLKHSETNH